MKKKTSVCNYFVDEAGDDILFDKKGKVLIGGPGCSNFFMLGLLQVDDPVSLGSQLNQLRLQLIADPYFSGVPSLQSASNKTAVAFHAKDDLPEVRREVFKILTQREDLHFFAVIRDKKKLLDYVQQRNVCDATYRYKPTELYDYLVRRLFRDRLHTHDSNEIVFARRGSSDRTDALKEALNQARTKFSTKYPSIINNSHYSVTPEYSKNSPCLQAVDYFLWSLQRLFERSEDRYVALLFSSFSLVVDMDDHRYAPLWHVL